MGGDARGIVGGSSHSETFWEEQHIMRRTGGKVPRMAPTASYISKVLPQFAHKVTKFHFKRMFCVTLCHLKESVIGPDTPADRRPERDGNVNDKLTDEILHCNGQVWTAGEVRSYSGTF